MQIRKYGVILGMLLWKLSAAQVSIPGADATWNLLSTGGDPFGDPCFYFKNYNLSVAGDTTIHAKSYTLLKNTLTYFYTENIVTGAICWSDTTDQNKGLIGAIRSDAGKTYFYKLSESSELGFGSDYPDTTDMLLYDFSMEPGDVSTVYKIDGSSSYDSVIYKEIITLADGIERIKLSIQNNISGLHAYYEGIGDAIYGLFGSTYYLPFESSITLQCYKEAGNFLIGPENCDFFDPVMAVSELNDLPKLQIWPNPCSDFCAYTIPHANGIMELYAIDGRILFSMKCHTGSGNVSVAELPTGVYILRYVNTTGNHTQTILQKQ